MNLAAATGLEPAWTGSTIQHLVSSVSQPDISTAPALAGTRTRNCSLGRSRDGLFHHEGWPAGCSSPANKLGGAAGCRPRDWTMRASRDPVSPRPQNRKPRRESNPDLDLRRVPRCITPRGWRHGPDSHRRIAVLRTAAFLLGDRAVSTVGRGIEPPSGMAAYFISSEAPRPFGPLPRCVKLRRGREPKPASR